MHALEGRLSEGALANLVQFLALNQASGCLQLVHGAGTGAGAARGAVYLRAGRVEHIEVEGLEGVAALSELLAWSQGRFAFAAGVFAPRRSLDLSVDALLLHASVVRDGAGSRNGSAGAAAGRAPHHAGTNGTANGLLAAGRPSGAAGLDDTARGGDDPDGEHAGAVPSGAAGGRRSGELLAGVLAPQSPTPSQPTLTPTPRVSPEPGLAAPALQATPLVDPTLVPGLVWAAVAVVGPIGEIFVQEAFESIGHSPRLLPESALGPLVLEVAGRFRSDEGRAQFVARAEAVLAHHGYGRVEEAP